VYCSVCKRETSSIKIGGDDYCSVCGMAYNKSASATTPTPQAPAATPAAAALHQRMKPAHTLDLRTEAAPAKAASSQPLIKHAPEQPHLGTASTAASSERHLHQFTDRFERARKMSRSAQISRFGADRLGSVQGSTAGGAGNQPDHPASHTVASPQRTHLGQTEMPRLAATQHEAMTKLPRYAPPATSTPKPAPALRTRSRLTISPQGSRVLSIATAVVIMGGYIWLQNYPKLAIQNASDRAGLAATLPTYIPSSYNLAGTATSPGAVTLKFTSPSAGEALKISQQRTTWDSSSLLDNYIAKSADDYAAVQGQGLTIYFFGQNQASWVNHGIWYSIQGAARLSREQILKIAYSL
jgi:hypothetical protein